MLLPVRLDPLTEETISIILLWYARQVADPARVPQEGRLLANTVYKIY